MTTIRLISETDVYQGHNHTVWNVETRAYAEYLAGIAREIGYTVILTDAIISK